MPIKHDNLGEISGPPSMTPARTSHSLRVEEIDIWRTMIEQEYTGRTTCEGLSGFAESEDARTSLPPSFLSEILGARRRRQFHREKAEKRHVER